MDNHSTRQSILKYLRNHPCATARQIAVALQLTPADIRYHMGYLQKAELISILPAKHHQTRRGRPARIYALSHQAAPDAHFHLLTVALSVLMKEETHDWAGNLEHLSRQILPLNDPLPNRFLPRITRLIEQLNHLQYHARWEARTNGPCIIFERCPFRNLLGLFPQLCEMDRRMLQFHLQMPVKLDQHIQPDQTQPADCRFTLQSGS